MVAAAVPQVLALHDADEQLMQSLLPVSPFCREAFTRSSGILLMHSLEDSGVHKGGFSKGGFSNDNTIITHKSLNPPLLNPPL